MSLDATRWAWQQRSIRPAEKLVLLSLADRADEQHKAFPSITRLQADTGLDRKTIIAAIDRLSAPEIGLITIERHIGLANIYRLNGVEDRHGTSTKNGTGKRPPTSTKNGTGDQYQKRDQSQKRDQYQKRDTNLPELFITPLPPTKPARFDPLADIPETINASAWADWIKYLREKRKPPTPSTVHRQWARLRRHDHATQAAMIDESIRSGWQGLFDPKPTNGANNNGNGSKTPHQYPTAPRKQSAVERVIAGIHAERAAQPDAVTLDPHGRPLRHPMD